MPKFNENGYIECTQWIGRRNHNQPTHFGKTWFSTSIWRLCVTGYICCMLQINDARLEDVKFYAYTANNNAAEVETIEVSVWGLLVWGFWDFFYWKIDKKCKFGKKVACNLMTYLVLHADRWWWVGRCTGITALAFTK